MPNFPPSVDELVEEFQDLEDWDERYDFIIDLGRELPPLALHHQAPENVVNGCMSTVWMVVDVHDDQTVTIAADSDSIIVKGLIVVLLSYYVGKNLAEIVQLDATEFFGELGLNQHLSPQRRNGLYSMVKRLKQLATQYLAGI